VWLCAGPGGQGDLLFKLQDGAGIDIGHCVQGERAEDEDKSMLGDRIFLISIFRLSSQVKNSVLTSKRFNKCYRQYILSILGGG